MEGSHALDSVDQRVEIVGSDPQQVHRERASLDVDAAESLGLAERLRPALLSGCGQGVDVTAAQWDADPILPESGIRPKIWRTWLPDIFLNPHGYPTHEWVQLFSEYAAWVRTRSVETRDYWTMRGWWMPGFAWLDDPR